MSDYFSFKELEALIPEGWLVESLDDDGSGSAEAFPEVLDDDGSGSAEAFPEVLDTASKAVNAPLSIRYATPVAGTEFICRTALLIAAETCYTRRNLGEQFPNAEELKMNRELLMQMAKGETEMAPQVTPVNPSGGVIQGPLRIPDRGGLNC